MTSEQALDVIGVAEEIVGDLREDSAIFGDTPAEAAEQINDFYGALAKRGRCRRSDGRTPG